jgi:drug/metabolite transporter (DMT)-like permease
VLPIALGLGAAACIGVGDFAAGVASRRITPLLVGFWTQAIGATLGLLLLVAMRPELAPGQLPWGLLAGLATGVGLALLYQAMAVGAISLVAPIVACSVVLPVVYSVAGGERLTPLATAGIVAVVAGVVLASLQPAPVPGDPTEAGTNGDRKAVLLAISAAVAFGIFYILVDVAPQQGDWGTLWTAGPARLSSFGVQTLLVLVARQRVIGPGRSTPHVAAAGILDQISLVLLGIGAMTNAYGIVTVLMGLYPVITALLGVLLLGERLTRVQTSGATLALAGAMLVSI